jgi:hypothetical protein
MSSTKLTPPANETSTLQPPQSVKVAGLSEEFLRWFNSPGVKKRASYDAGYYFIKKNKMRPVGQSRFSEVINPKSFDATILKSYIADPKSFKLGMRLAVTQNLKTAFWSGYLEGGFYEMPKYSNVDGFKGFMLDVAEKGRRHGAVADQQRKESDPDGAFNSYIPKSYIDSVVNYLLKDLPPFLRSSSQKETTVGSVAERNGQPTSVKTALRAEPSKRKGFSI